MWEIHRMVVYLALCFHVVRLSWYISYVFLCLFVLFLPDWWIKMNIFKQKMNIIVICVEMYGDRQWRIQEGRWCDLPWSDWIFGYFFTLFLYASFRDWTIKSVSQVSSDCPCFLPVKKTGSNAPKLTVLETKKCFFLGKGPPPPPHYAPSMPTAHHSSVLKS